MTTSYDILYHPDKRLRTKAKAVGVFDDTLEQITNTMYHTMYEARGIGLAATQVNIHQRIVVLDVPFDREDEHSKRDKFVMINPQILSQSDNKATYQEGCLSLPEQFAEVTRPEQIHYRYQDIHGNTHEAQAQGLLAVCIQHEIDHLNGILFIDHLSRLKRERIEKKLQKLLKAKT